MDVFLPAWIVFAYATYVFIAERISLFPPRKFSSDKHGIRAYKRVLGYWIMGSLMIAGLVVSLLLPGETLLNKGIVSSALSIILCLPGAFNFYMKRQAS